MGGRCSPGLLDAGLLMHLDELPKKTGELALSAGFTEVRIYVADLERHALHLLTGPDAAAPPDSEPVRGRFSRGGGDTRAE
ncbi:hypothetical protein [Streptomyces sp. Root1310]|uniref:hypothetical protein n=1 Tax=Streptomyces sp. Root1310 TaxID=1736452 RepID=UPI000710BF16|nr:hypothetical protein [Streptomyces sp. Root1310]KQX61257.1 hypothetical protein ASD48_29190 [Streptomyces sp. Root1310]